MLCFNHVYVLLKKYLVDCDEVIFMREGSITEKGSHEDLMNLNGDYAAMFNNLQLGDTPFIEVRPPDSFTCLRDKSVISRMIITQIPDMEETTTGSITFPHGIHTVCVTQMYSKAKFLTFHFSKFYVVI